MVRLTRDNQGYFDRLQRARSWVAKAQAVARSPEGWGDLHAQFIFYWIALNALYGRGRAEQVSDTKDLDWFVDLVCDFDVSTGAIRTALEQLSRHAGRLLGEKFLFEPYWDMGTTPKVERMLQAERSSAVAALDNGDVATYLRLLLRGLRVARNQVFHGSSSDRSEKGRMGSAATFGARGAALGGGLRKVVQGGRGSWLCDLLVDSPWTTGSRVVVLHGRLAPRIVVPTWFQRTGSDALYE